MLPEASTIGGDQSVEQLRRELAEAREQQTATAEILRVISSSPMDLGGVFASIAASAARLCDANDAVIHRVDGDVLSLVAHYGPILAPSTLPLNAGFFIGRAVLDKQTIHVGDVQSATNEYPEGSELAKGLMGTILAVPLIHAGKAVGGISIRRAEVRAFTDRQIELIRVFADQAVIAIENTRLFEAEQKRTRELTESLEQQTATSEVLRVISSSPGELGPVFETILESAVRLCDAKFGTLFLCVADAFRAVATRNIPPAMSEFYEQRGSFHPPPGTPLHQLLRTKQLVQRSDDSTDQVPSAAARLGGARSHLAVPMLKENELIGAINIYHQEVRPFTDKQIELVSNFAKQAVIAIENTRLLNELRESLQQQTATADVLKV